ncbi:hypothetical protein ABT034_34335 [Streptomyces sp. NPDC002773]|uniref:hypothetical protein n=1 Tax=Streptomyces sp. NPDC002773 TaxID=3154430 RepID=UPI00333044F0
MRTGTSSRRRLASRYTSRGEDQDLAVAIGRLRVLTATGDFVYFTDAAHFMAGLPLPERSTIRWTRSEDEVRSAWHGLVQARQEHLVVARSPPVRCSLRGWEPALSRGAS